MTKADRDNADKAQWHYLLTFSDALEEVARVSEHGAKKYAPYNYVKGAPASEHIDSAQRHIAAYWNGADVDSSSDRHHLAHAAWNILRCLQEEMARPAGYQDDRNGYGTALTLVVEPEVSKASVEPVLAPGVSFDWLPVNQETGWQKHAELDLWICGMKSISAVGGGGYVREDGTGHTTWHAASRHAGGVPK